VGHSQALQSNVKYAYGLLGVALLAVVSRPPTKSPSTAPASGPAPAGGARTRPSRKGPEIALLRYTGSQWQQVSVAPAPLTGVPSVGKIAVDGEKIYVVLGRPGRKLLAFESGTWSEIALPAAMTPGKVLALTAMNGQVVLALLDVPAPGQIGVAGHAAGKWNKLQPLRSGADAMTWTAKRSLVASRAGDGLAVAWREGTDWQYARFALSGQRVRAPESILADAGSTERANKYMDYFLMGVLMSLVVLMFWPGQTVRTSPFSLPEGIRPARLSKRAIAAVIDIAPFAVACYLAAGRPDPDVLYVSIRDKAVPARQVYSLLGALGAYAIYGMVLEVLYGATLGKKAMQMRVVGDGGRRPMPREVALRNIAKIAELPLWFLMVVFPLLSRYRQRLGDKIGWTAVIEVPPPPGPEAPESPDVTPPDWFSPGAEDDRRDEKL
ncbi:hypothetical protein LCGC14_1743240, partial [marine sediment metagenome]